MAIDHSRSLQAYVASVPAACDALTLTQTAAMELQATTAASFAVTLMQLSVKAQLPGSLLYRLALLASLAIFTGGAICIQWYLQQAQLAAGAFRAEGLDFLTRSICEAQYTPLQLLMAMLHKAADAQRLLQLYGRTVAATPAAGRWLATAAQGMCAASQQGAVDLRIHARFAAICRHAVLGSDPCIAGLRQAAERDPELLAALGLALIAGLAARAQALGEDAAAAPGQEAAEHMHSAGRCLRNKALGGMWTAAARGSGSQLQQQAAGQLLEAAGAALQLAAMQPSLPADAPDIQRDARGVQLTLLPHMGALLGSVEYGELAARARHVLLRAAPAAVAALRTAAWAAKEQPLFGPALQCWCFAVQTAASTQGRQEQTVEQLPQLQLTLGAAAALLRLLPLLDVQRLQQRQMQSPPGEAGHANLLEAGASALAMLDSVADWAASWVEAEPAAAAVPALRKQLWRLLTTATKGTCAAAQAGAEAQAAAEAAMAGQVAAAPAVSVAPDADVVRTAGTADGQADEAAATAAAEPAAAGASLQLLADCVAAGLETVSSASASLQRTADQLWAASGTADAQSWRDAHTLALLLLQTSLARLLGSPVRLPPHEQPIPCGDAFSIAAALLKCATRDEQLFLSQPAFSDALVAAVDDALLQPLPEGAAGELEGLSATLREDASPGMTLDLLDSLVRAIQKHPCLAVALLQHGLGMVGAAAILAGSRAAAAGAAADVAANQGAAAGPAADPAGSQGVAADAASDAAGGQDAAAGAAADAGSRQNDATATAADSQGNEVLSFECQLVCIALDGSLRESLQAALQRHGAGLESSGDTHRSSSGGGASSSASSSKSEPLPAALAAAKQAADSVRLLEQGEEIGERERTIDLTVLVQVAAHLQEVWRLEQTAEEQSAARLRLAAAAALRSCAHLRCTDLRGASEAECRGKKCRGCETLRFCSEACQRADWRQGGHRHVCRLLAQRRQQQAQQAAAGGGPET